MSSVAKALNTNETCKFLDSVPEGESIKKIIYFGESFNKDFLEKEVSGEYVPTGTNSTTSPNSSPEPDGIFIDAS